MAVVWVILGVGLLLVELRHLAFYALFAAVGAFGASVVALVAPSAVPLQAGVAVVLGASVGFETGDLEAVDVMADGAEQEIGDGVRHHAGGERHRGEGPEGHVEASGRHQAVNAGSLWKP